MTFFDWQRARQPEQKEQRRQEILRAAAKLFDETGLEKASLSKIACSAGLSKAALYRYFESREAIFLELLGGELTGWVARFEAALAPLAGSNDPARVARAFAASLVDSHRLGALSAATPTILEHNVSEEVVVAFKTGLIPLFLRLANSLHAALPALSMEQVRELLAFAHSAINGLWPAAHPPPAVQRALARPELELFRVPWGPTLERMIQLLLEGALAEGAGSSEKTDAA
ncbi:MAG: TetR family transcriptional regulator [Deltaproteobacteria bacterium]|nr:TetR family transcriptional regulator [Deltaproteobacteria bacterium]